MVRIRDLQDDNYYFDEDNYCLRGRKSGKVLTLGNKVRIEIKRADLVKKQLDFILVDLLDTEESKKTQLTSKKEIKKGGHKKPTAPSVENEVNAAPIANKTSPKNSTALRKTTTPGKLFNEEWGFEV